LRHAFTVDVEDWHQGIPISPQSRASAEGRLERGMLQILELLEEHGCHGTFFVLGPVAQEHARLIRRVAEAGHEIGCHGWSHDPLYQMTPKRFRDETRWAMDALSSITGKPVTAYRAPYFSITSQSLWALEELAGLGFLYDSSIFPIRNWRYGIPEFEPRPRRVTTPSGPIMEFPISVRRMLGRNLAVSGGAYFRIYPYAITRSNFCALEAQKKPVVFYIHPWELDPDHPRVPFNWRARLTHYANLRSTGPKLRRMLTDFQFGSLGEVLENELA
jgi:polysaccharide deacetylase family protein (PEP-CTERM system associated)